MKWSMNPFLPQLLTRMMRPWWDLELNGCCRITAIDRVLSEVVIFRWYVVGSFVGLLIIECVDYVLG